ncbi:hypothetical protein O1611_g5119 [Lasiodiplodia mahajangana]|uniref:Uncharacterized protein n=1 Tax=Lasiodiplodia mahajangana TaxID=1108764 RepID=A0ACC2JMN4_9PEZI|nr:hypothetical protein O1611_g5119 [Lasiodiplodia mahajangana]
MLPVTRGFSMSRFGITHSSATWALSLNRNELVQINSWPASRTNDSCVRSIKVQTQIRYLANGEFEWGAQVPVNADPGQVHRFSQLALEPSLFQNTVGTIGGFPIPPNVDKIMTDFMTVPATWRDVSKQRTVEAFRRIPNLPNYITTSLLSEPGAANIPAFRGLGGSSMVLSGTAQRHYGFERHIQFDGNVHASLWNEFSGAWYVSAMDWFIMRGAHISENMAFTTPYSYAWPIGETRPRIFPQVIYADEVSPTAPIACSGNVRPFCYLNSGLSQIPDNQLERRRGVNGRMYYCLEFSIEWIYYSASTQYKLIYKGQRYDAVEVHYV